MSALFVLCTSDTLPQRLHPRFHHFSVALAGEACLKRCIALQGTFSISWPVIRILRILHIEQGTGCTRGGRMPRALGPLARTRANSTALCNIETADIKLLLSADATVAPGSQLVTDSVQAR